MTLLKLFVDVSHNISTKKQKSEKPNIVRPRVWFCVLNGVCACVPAGCCSVSGCSSGVPWRSSHSGRKQSRCYRKILILGSQTPDLQRSRNRKIRQVLTQHLNRVRVCLCVCLTEGAIGVELRQSEVCYNTRRLRARSLCLRSNKLPPAFTHNWKWKERHLNHQQICCRSHRVYKILNYNLSN